MIYIGIDPGRQGGIAAIRQTGDPAYSLTVQSAKNPETESDAVELLRSFARDFDGEEREPVCVSIEQVSGWLPGARGKGSHMLKLGFSKGLWVGALCAFRFPYGFVSASKWQRAFVTKKPSKDGLSSAAADKIDREHKNKLKQAAQRLFPDINITLATCDAILIAEHLRRTYK